MVGGPEYGVWIRDSGEGLPTDWFWCLTPIPDGNTNVPRALSGIAISGLVTLVASPDGTITVDELYDVWPVLVGSSVHRYADVDGDDSMEIVVAGSEFFASPPNSWLDTLEPDDDQGWLLASETPLAEGTGPSGLEVTDVDGDGILDAVVAQRSVISWYRGTGDWGFTLAGTADVDESIVNLVTRDFDGDGRAEVVVSVPSQWRVWYFDDVNGIPLAARRKIDVYRHPCAVAAGDVDGDGDQDLVVTSKDEPSLTVLANDGTRAFAMACQHATGWDPWIVSTAPLDEPVGRPASDDMVVVNLEDNSLMTFVGACDDIDTGRGLDRRRCTWAERTTTIDSCLPITVVPDGASGAQATNFENGGGVMNGASQRICGILFATTAIVLGLLGPGCEDEPIHASLLETDATPTPTPFDQTAWWCPLSVDEGWIVAQTEVQLWIPEQTWDTFDVYVRHEEGTLVLGGTSVPPDTWGLATGAWIPGRSQLLVTATFASHTFQFDADVSDTSLEGWFTMDETYELFALCFLDI